MSIPARIAMSLVLGSVSWVLLVTCVVLAEAVTYKANDPGPWISGSPRLLTAGWVLSVVMMWAFEVRTW